MIMLIAKVLPEEKILNDLKDAIQNYQLVPSEENKKQIEINCMLFQTKISVEREGFMEMASRLNEIERADRAMNGNSKN